MRVTCIALYVCLGFVSVVSGQEFRATITGHITDSSGGAVPHVTVRAVHIQTNESSTASTDMRGVYTLPFLRPGSYTLTAEAKGFKKIVREGLVLQVGQVAGVDLALEVGNAVDTVTVTAETPLLETETAMRGGVVDPTNVTDLPLNSRTPWFLAGMMSAVTFRGELGWNRPFDGPILSAVTINGGRQGSNDFLIDGAPHNGREGGSATISYVPIVDTLQEFRVQTNLYDAQYGHTGGGVMNAILKSGSNEFHGTGWGFFRRTPLDTNTFQGNAAGRSTKTEHSLDQWGFQASGPLYFPKLYNGRNKSFFLAAFERYDEIEPNPSTVSTPAPEFLTGDFSKLVDAGGNPITLYNPLTGREGPNGTWIRDPFAGNIIPANMINPIAAKIMSYWPKPNATTPGSRYSTNNLRLPDQKATNAFYNLTLRFDQNFGNKHRLFFRHSSSDRSEMRVQNGIVSGPGQWGGGGGTQPYQRLNDSYVLDWVGTLSSSLIVNARFSANRYVQKSAGRDNAGFDLTTLGFPEATVRQLPGGPFFGTYNLGGYTPIGVYPATNISNDYNLGAGLTKIQGSHSLHAGIDARRTHIIPVSLGNVWSWNGSSQWTQNTFTNPLANTGDAAASFLLGLPSGASSNYPLFPFWQRLYIAPYIQDDWKVSRRLTLNLGLRWDVNTPVGEKYNRMNSIFDTTLANPVSSRIDRTRFPEVGALMGGLTFAGVDGRPTTAANIDWNNFQPRVGAAYRLSDRLVLRGGYGIVHMDPGTGGQLATGFNTSTTVQTSLDGNRTPARSDLMSNPYPDGLLTPPGASQGALTFLGRNPTTYYGDFQVPKVHQFSFGVQYQLTASTMIDVSYVGSRGRQLEVSGPLNLPSLEFRRKCNPIEGGSPAYCDQQVPNPFQGIEAFSGTTYFTASTIRRYDLNRPFPQFNGDLTQNGQNYGNASYNSLQINYSVRMKTGLSMVANYTFSKNMESLNYIDTFRGVLDKSLSGTDQPHVFKVTTVYPLPFGRGKRFGNNSGRLVNALIDGWELTNLFNARSGEPANLPGNVRILKDPKLDSVDWSAHQVAGWNQCVLRMDNNGSIAPVSTAVQSMCGTDQSNYAWMILPSYAARETTFRSPNIRMRRVVTMDASLIKTTRITERVRAQFRGEVFNVLNHYVYPMARFNTDPGAGVGFGTILPGTQFISATSFPRVIQLGVKLLW